MASSKPSLPSVEPTYDPNRPLPDIKTLYNNPLPNVPGKSVVSYLVSLSPNGSTPPHHHAGAFVSAHVLSGHIINGMNNDPMELLGPGEDFSEHPGCHHRISDNASPTEPATFIATLVLDTKTVDELGVNGLSVIEDKYIQMIAKAQQKS